MTHVAAAVPNLSYACDTHYPWQDEDILVGGRITFHEGALRVPTTPGLGVQIDRNALAKLHDQYLACGIRNRNDRAQMQKYDPSFTGVCPRF
jgi:glucarate dehydratase